MDLKHIPQIYLYIVYIHKFTTCLLNYDHLDFLIMQTLCGLGIYQAASTHCECRLLTKRFTFININLFKNFYNFAFDNYHFWL